MLANGYEAADFAWLSLHIMYGSIGLVFANYAKYRTNILSAYIPVKKGDTVQLTYSNVYIADDCWFRFIYAEGSEND